MQSVMWRWKNEKPPKRQGFWNVEKMGGEPVQKDEEESYLPAIHRCL